jgi:hypothetical protein
MVTNTLLTVLPVSAFFALCYRRVQIVDTPDLSEPGSLQQLSMFVCKQTGKNHKNTFYEYACVYLSVRLFICFFVLPLFFTIQMILCIMCLISFRYGTCKL